MFNNKTKNNHSYQKKGTGVGLFGLSLCVAIYLCLFCLASPVHAAVTTTGDVQPTDPATWTPSTWVYVGRIYKGTLSITDGSEITIAHSLIGYNYSTTRGEVTVDGVGSILTSSRIGVGSFYGNGTLDITNGGKANSDIVTIGYDPGSTGVATVDGVGSIWMDTGNMIVGRAGSGTLNITDGGVVSNNDGYIGYGIVSHLSSTGEVTVDGGNSTWTNRDLYVGRYGSGSLNIIGGGTVTVERDTKVADRDGSSGAIHFDNGTLTTGGLFCSSEDLTGTGTINTHGMVSNIDLIFDATHGVNQTININDTLSQNITVNLNVDGTGYMGIGYGGIGTMTIADGIVVQSTDGYVGYKPDSSGEVTIDGAGSTWANSTRLYIGREGSGTLNITGGGMVSSDSGIIGSKSGSTGEVAVDGTGSTWTSGDLFVGSLGSGTLNITNGGEVIVERDTRVADRDGSSGTIHFDNGTLTTGSLGCVFDDLTGTGIINTNGLISDGDLIFDATHGLNQTFNINKNIGQNITLNLTVDGTGLLGAGYRGVGTMSISDGIVVESDSGRIGYNSGSTGEVTVDGAGSTWTTGMLNVAHSGNDRQSITAGNGSLNITDGGVVNSQYCIIGGNGSKGKVTVDGVNSIWTNGDFSFNNGILNITGGGKVVNNGRCFIGSRLDMTGKGVVDGIGSTWTIKGMLNIGGGGQWGRNSNGILNITGGGEFNSDVCTIGSIASFRSSFESISEVTVNGTGSTWTNNTLFVGFYSSGTLNITDGGLVSVASILTIDANGDGDSFINMASGGMLALAGDADDSLGDFLDLVDGTDAIRYWDASAFDWADIVGATIGEDYTLSLGDGDLAGYTVLTVLAEVPVLGDVNGDGVVDGFDVDPFVTVLLDGVYQVEADANQDGVVNGFDVDPFVALVLGGGEVPGGVEIPEPCTLILVSLGGLAILKRRQ